MERIKHRFILYTYTHTTCTHRLRKLVELLPPMERKPTLHNVLEATLEHVQNERHHMSVGTAARQPAATRPPRVSRVCINVYVHTHINTHIYMCVCVYICIYLELMYIYTCIHAFKTRAIPAMCKHGLCVCKYIQICMLTCTVP